MCVRLYLWFWMCECVSKEGSTLPLSGCFFHIAGMSFSQHHRNHCMPPPPKKRGPGAELMGALTFLSYI